MKAAIINGDIDKSEKIECNPGHLIPTTLVDPKIKDI